MDVVRSEEHRLHFPRGELSGGVLVRPHECPERWDIVLARLEQQGFERFVDPGPLELAAVRRVHDAGFLEFLESAWSLWERGQHPGEALPLAVPARRMRQLPPRSIEGRLGYYAMALDSAITAGTWRAARSSAAVAQTAQRLVSAGRRTAFALCRPPGHHAGRDLYGGYCFLNNAAIAAQGFRDDGARRVALLDVDFHHGNGSQDVFYERDDVLVLSLHGRPEEAFPYFTGYADERGTGRGEGANRNYPLPSGTAYAAWSAALEDACRTILAHGSEALVVSLGVDTFEGDPLGSFRLTSEDFRRYGGRLARLGLPTLFVMEGGYAVAEIGINAVNVLSGFLDG